MNKFLTNKKISVVIPCFNEAENIYTMYERLVKVFEKITPNKEFIFVDNNSTDNSERIYEDLCSSDKDVSAIIMSRNFGTSDSSYTAGTEYASGDAIVWIDGDIQDPPELISQLTEKWLQGYNVVYGIRKKRNAGFFWRWAANAFYKILNRYSYVEMPLYAGDFCIIDRKVADIFNSFPERDRFVRGLRAWVGFKHTGIEYTRLERNAGKPFASLGIYFRIAKKGIISFSYSPLTLISNIALVAMFLSLFALFIYPILAIFYPAPRGYLTILILMLFIASTQFFVLAILGEYVARIFEEVKGRPKYIIGKILNNHRV